MVLSLLSEDNHVVEWIPVCAMAVDARYVQCSCPWHDVSVAWCSPAIASSRREGVDGAMLLSSDGCNK